MYTKTTTTYTLSTNFIRVTYPDFTIKYDLDDADVNKGDVKVWDTRGTDTESEWQRVFDPSHVFVGDCVVENGLIRINLRRQKNGLVYYWDGNNWAGGYKFGFRTDSYENHGYIYDLKIAKVNCDIAAINIHWKGGTGNPSEWLKETLTLERGKYYWIEEVIDKYNNEYSTCLYAAGFRIFYGNDEVRDYDLSLYSPIGLDNNNYVVAIDETPTNVLLGIWSDKIDNVAVIYQLLRFDTPVQNRWGFFVIPFSKVANLFKEAENATLGSGATVDTTQTDDSGDSVLLDAQNESISYYFTGVTDLPKGRYIAFIRAKDTNQVTNDFRLHVQNDTDGRILNEEGGFVYKTLTSSFSYYGVVFDITDDDDGDTCRVTALKAQTDANSIYVDYFLIVPISNGESWPQDLAHNAMRTYTKRWRVKER